MINDTESVTAKICSFVRAYHSNFEKEKIFDDYLAFDLMGRDEYEEVGQLIEHEYRKDKYDPAYFFKGARIKDTLNKYFSPIPLSRAAYAEKELWRFAYDRGECQYVICGAGMDTFSFRNDNPNIKVFEIDHPDTQRYKLQKIKKLEWIIPENVHFVSVDFSKDDMAEKLIEAGYDPKLPSFFAIMGVTYYLTLPVFEETIKSIGEISSFGSKVVFDYPDEITTDEFFKGREYYEKIRHTSGFSVDVNKCSSCGLCAKQCPLGGIEMEDGHPVWKKDKCTLCLGWYHRCPEHAIDFMKCSDNGQYTNIKVGLDN